MRGWLITNAFLHSQKFSEISLWLVTAAKNKGIELIEKTNSEVLAYLDSDFMEGKVTGDYKVSNDHKMNNDYKACRDYKINSTYDRPDFVLFWDKDVRLARFLELLGLPVFNSSKAIGICDDKSLTHLCLQSAGIKMPETIIAPMTYSNIGYTNYDFLDKVADKLSFPMIVKECFGSFGQQVYMVSNRNELEEKVREIGGKPMIFQKFIASSKGKDIRLQVVGNQVIASMYRYSDNGDFRANISNGGKMMAYEPSEEQIRLAVQCCQHIGLDFGGVDILFGEKSEPIVCEVNSNAHFKNIFDCTGINAAEYILDYIINRIA